MLRATVPLTLQLGGPMARFLPFLHNLESLKFPPSASGTQASVFPTSDCWVYN